MKFTVKPSGPVKGGYERFDLVLEEDDGKPLMTIKGWRLAKWRFLMPPQSYSTKQIRFNVVEIHDEEFAERLIQSALRKIDPDETKRMQAPQD